jgi:rare lipoprotein A
MVLALATALLGACTSSTSETSQTTRPGVVQATLRPYQIKGVWYYPKIDNAYDETGIASWYGEPFHGRKTAIGEVYDMNEMTAAHKTLHLPANVRVTNLENGRSVILRVNDRGPFVNERIIDVSRRGAQLLGFQNQGTARVRVQIVGDGGEPAGTTVPRPTTTPEERTAGAAAPVGTVTAAPLPPPGRPAPAPAPAAPRPAPAPLPSAAPVTPPPAVVTQGPVRATSIYVQAGAFLKLNNAQLLRDKLARYGRSFVATAKIDNQTFYRVRVGPLKNVDEADIVLDQIIASGQTGARIIVD